MKVTYIGHACMMMESAGTRILMDPWLTDPTYHGTWWHYPPLEIGVRDLPKLDYLYVSHEHPDHFDPPTLRQLDKDVHVVIPNFKRKRFRDRREHGLGLRAQIFSDKERVHRHRETQGRSSRQIFHFGGGNERVNLRRQPVAGGSGSGNHFAFRLMRGVTGVGRAEDQRLTDALHGVTRPIALNARGVGQHDKRRMETTFSSRAAISRLRTARPQSARSTPLDA